MGSVGAVTQRITTEAQEKTLSKLIKQTANLKKEQYRTVDDEGNVTFMKQGKNDQVAMTVGEKRQFLDGAVTIHNHPQIDEGLGGPFSSNDLTDFGYGAKAIVVASNEGEYRLVNLNYGTKEQSAGWRGLQSEIQKITDAESTSAILRQTNDIMAKSEIGKQMRAVSDRWVKRKEAGADKAELDAISKQYNSLEKAYRTQRGQVQRKLVLQPYHEAYKKYARKYGFEYIYPKNVY